MMGPQTVIVERCEWSDPHPRSSQAGRVPAPLRSDWSVAGGFGLPLQPQGTFVKPATFDLRHPAKQKVAGFDWNYPV